MHHDDAYESWKADRGRADVPEDFADRVMDAIAARAIERRRDSALRLWLLGLLASRAVRVGIGTLACAACAVRVLYVVALFLMQVPLAE